MQKKRKASFYLLIIEKDFNYIYLFHTLYSFSTNQLCAVNIQLLDDNVLMR